MGVAPGSPVSASNTNNAFLDANADDTGIGIYNLQNTVTASGAQQNNIQAEMNGRDKFMGRGNNVGKDSLPTWTDTSVGASTDSLAVRAEELTVKFNNSTGHKHTGGLGDAPNIQAGDLASVALHGYFIQGVDLTGVTGSSTNVTTQMSGKTASAGSSSKGVVVTAPYNRDVIRDFNDESYFDGSGNLVYGRITFSSGTWTLSYYSEVTGTETPYSFSGSHNVRWYFQELFNPITDAPVYSELATVPSENTTADILFATETDAGKMYFANAVPPQIAGTGSKGGSGSPTRAAYADHTHEGVHSLGAYGVVGTPPMGDVLLEGGSGVTLSYNSGRIKIASGGAVAYQEFLGTGNGSTTTFGPLTFVPSDSNSVLVMLDGLVQEISDWSLSGSSIVFGTAPETDQRVYVFYVTGGTPTPPPVVTGAMAVEYRTITSGEASAKQLTLANTPATPSNVQLDLINGTAQKFNVDFTVSSNILTWNGYSLDGVLAQNDELRIVYIY